MEQSSVALQKTCSLGLLERTRPGRLSVIDLASLQG